MSTPDLLSFFTPSWAQPGTGLPDVARAAVNFTGGVGVSRDLQLIIIPMLPGLFGDYPISSDVAPCAVFIAAYGLLFLAYGFLLVNNWRAGYRSWLLPAFMAYCLCKMIGYGLRINWTQDLLRINLGVASVVFNLVPVVLLNLICMVFGYRVFKWRHPVTGGSTWMKYLINHVYVLVVPILVMATVSQALPYIRFMTPNAFHVCQRITKAAAVLNFLYSFCGVALVQIAFSFKPGTIDDRLFRIPKRTRSTTGDLPTVVQPYWIRNVSLFSFPRFPTKEAEHTHSTGFDTSYSSPYRLIASREAPAGCICRVRSPPMDGDDFAHFEGLHSRQDSSVSSSSNIDDISPNSNKKKTTTFEHNEKVNYDTTVEADESSQYELGVGSPPSIKVAIAIVVVMSLGLALSTLMRLVSVFISGPRGGFIPTSTAKAPSNPNQSTHMNSWFYRNYVEYIFYGGLEWCINVMLIVYRADLRFYVPGTNYL